MKDVLENIDEKIVQLTDKLNQYHKAKAILAKSSKAVLAVPQGVMKALQKPVTHWDKIKHVLKDGPVKPSEIHKTTGINPKKVSNILQRKKGELVKRTKKGWSLI